MESRILAIDLRARFFGFAVFEGAGALLDWGRKAFRNGNPQDDAMIVRKRIAFLLTFFAPSILVLKCSGGRTDGEPSKGRKTIEVIRRQTEIQSVELVFLTRKDIQRAFLERGKSSKYRIACLIAEIFPELAWKLPPKRKNWQPEHHNMTIFDAVSLGLTYFLHDSRSD